MSEWPTRISEFRPQPSLERVVSGIGSVRARLAEVLDAHGAARPLIVCGGNVAQTPALDLVSGALGAAARIYDGSRPHTPVETVNRGAEQARAHRADAIIGLGGSSAIDCAKGIARLLTSGATDVRQIAPLQFGQLSAAPVVQTGERLLQVSITTTLSFAEFQPFWGCRDAGARTKQPRMDGDTARVIFLDGELAATTPARIWNETGVKAIDDALSAFVRSDAPEPFLDPLLTRAISTLSHLLPQSESDPSPEMRQRALHATWLTKAQLPRLGAYSVPSWFSTAARHSLGAVYGIAHGAASVVALPIGLRFHAASSGARQRELAAALGWPPPDHDAAPLGPGLDRLLDALALPRSLRVLGCDETQLETVADRIVHEAPTLGTRADMIARCREMY